MIQVLGDHLGQTFELGQYETTVEAMSVKKREERNGHYENIVMRDYDEYAAGEYAKLPQDELEKLAKVGDQYARAALGIGVPSKEERIAALREQLAELEGPSMNAQQPTLPVSPGGGE